jgi:hypothetical protein
VLPPPAPGPAQGWGAEQTVPPVPDLPPLPPLPPIAPPPSPSGYGAEVPPAFRPLHHDLDAPTADGDDRDPPDPARGDVEDST